MDALGCVVDWTVLPSFLQLGSMTGHIGDSWQVAGVAGGTRQSFRREKRTKVGPNLCPRTHGGMTVHQDLEKKQGTN